MKRIPVLSSLFATWASAGQYGDVADLDSAVEESKPAVRNVHSLPTGNRKKAIGGVQQFGSSVSEPSYIDGSMLVKRRIG
jgi:hypothetical protein